MLVLNIKITKLLENLSAAAWSGITDRGLRSCTFTVPAETQLQCKVFVLDCQGTLCQSTSTQPVESTEELIGEQGSERDGANVCAFAICAWRVQLAFRINSPSKTHHMLSFASIHFLRSPDVRCMIRRSDKVSAAALWGAPCSLQSVRFCACFVNVLRV